jgi:medium-chain acyl-[acyl-carrier-protein] hydrolase
MPDSTFMPSVKPVKPSKWWLRSNSSASQPIRLFCFPYAGGGPAVFSGWPRLLGGDYEVCTLSLPGRGARMREASICGLEEILQSLYGNIQDLLDVPFMFFGHSMGALLAFELARKLHRKRNKLPRVLFVSGARAPHLRWKKKTFDLPENEFLAEIYRLNGIPEELAREKSFIDMVVPALRADFQICQTYTFSDEEPLPLPIHVFGGTEDTDVTEQDLQGWAAHTASGSSLMLIRGDHFFINTAPQEVVDRVKRFGSYYFRDRLAMSPAQ